MKKINTYRLLLFIATLVNFSTLAVAQSIVTPASFSGLKLWIIGDSCKLSNSQLIDTIYDLSGNANHAIQTNSAYKPTINLFLLNSHKTVVFDGIDDALNFNDINDIRTIFWVIKDENSTSNYFRPLLGHTSIYDFYRSTPTIWDATYTNSHIINGVTTLNSNIINGTTNPFPNSFSLLDVVTTGSVMSNSFSNDRGIAGRVWFGQLVELIVYNQPLTNTQVSQIENYQNNKNDADKFF